VNLIDTSDRIVAAQFRVERTALAKLDDDAEIRRRRDAEQQHDVDVRSHRRHCQRYRRYNHKNERQNNNNTNNNEKKRTFILKRFQFTFEHRSTSFLQQQLFDSNIRISPGSLTIQPKHQHRTIICFTNIGKPYKQHQMHHDQSLCQTSDLEFESQTIATLA
jgi:hypothetical protein